MTIFQRVSRAIEHSQTSSELREPIFVIVETLQDIMDSINDLQIRIKNLERFNE